jgi:hypothetical protein
MDDISKNGWPIVAKMAERVTKSQKWLTNLKNDWVTEREWTRTKKWLTKLKNDWSIIAKNGWARGEISKNGWATYICAEHASTRGVGRAARDRDAWRYCGGGMWTRPRALTWEAGAGRTQGRRARVRVGVAGSVDRLTRWLVWLLGPGDRPIDPSP